MRPSGLALAVFAVARVKGSQAMRTGDMTARPCLPWAVTGCARPPAGNSGTGHVQVLPYFGDWSLRSIALAGHDRQSWCGPSALLTVV
jgi:hypothetical protein